jgi:surface protein
MSNPRYGSGKQQFIGQSIEADLTVLDPAAYTGAVVYSQGELYYSDGNEWIVPQDEVDIARPRNLAPTNALEQAQLRLSAFRSPTGETQTGIIFEINADGEPSFTEAANVLTRTVTSEVASLYDVLYPDDGFEPGDTIWWRARYLGTNSTQSQFSLPTAQRFPDLITTPSPITPQNAITGTVTLSDFESAPVFGIEYLETQVEFYNVGDEPGVDTPIDTVTQTGGSVTTVPIPPLVPGQNYQWRGRYGGRQNVGAPTIYSDWSTTRTIFLGAASIILEYDIDLMNSRTAYVPINTLNNVLKPLNVTIEWGDGTENTYTTAGIKSHTYAAGFNPTDGLVVVTITGTMDWYGTTSTIDQSGLVRVENIGFQMGLESLQGAFRGTKTHLTYITPNIPETVTSFRNLFRESSCAADLRTMDTRNITDMTYCFYRSIGAGPQIEGWDVSSVTDASYMFSESQFNQPFDNCNWASCTNMSYMFGHYNNNGSSITIPFNQPINGWNVSNVQSMFAMFGVRKATNLSAGTLTSLFNQPLDNWDVSSVTDMRAMFGGIVLPGNSGWPNFESYFNQPIGNWDVSSVTQMDCMFGHNSTAITGLGSRFNQDLTGWDVSNVTSASYMFGNNLYFQGDISTWNLASCTNMVGMFQRTYSNSGGCQPVIQNGTQVWQTPVIGSAAQMFYGNTNFNNPLDLWDTSGITSMTSMFRGAWAFNQPIGTWDTSNVTSMAYMFADENYVIAHTMAFNQDIGDWDVSKVTNMDRMFGAINDGNLTRCDHLFNNGGSDSIKNWDTSSVTNMRGMFGYFMSVSTGYYFRSRFNQPIGDWDVSNVATMEKMFAVGRGNAVNNRSYFNQDLSGWNLRADGVVMTNFMPTLATYDWTEENYSRTLTGWANKIADVNSGPFSVSFTVSGRVYNTTAYQPGDRFTNAADARAYLVAARSLSVASASTADADGDYTLDLATGTYDKANGWYFLQSGGSWSLYDDTDTEQATGSGNFPWEVATWTGVLASATVLSSGAAWSITGDSAA